MQAWLSFVDVDRRSGGSTLPHRIRPRTQRTNLSVAPRMHAGQFFAHFDHHAEGACWRAVPAPGVGAIPHVFRLSN